MASNLPNFQAYDFFVYEVDYAGLAPGASITNSFTVQQEAYFLLTKLTMMVDEAGASITNNTRPVPLVTMTINDTGSGRNLMASAVPLANLFGQGGLPFILPRQRIFVPSSVVNITLSNYSVADTYNIRLSFIGEKGFV
jgi:hypothetical protein